MNWPTLWCPNGVMLLDLVNSKSGTLCSYSDQMAYLSIMMWSFVIQSCVTCCWLSVFFTIDSHAKETCSSAQKNPPLSKFLFHRIPRGVAWTGNTAARQDAFMPSALFPTSSSFSLASATCTAPAPPACSETQLILGIAVNHVKSITMDSSRPVHFWHWFSKWISKGLFRVQMEHQSLWVISYISYIFLSIFISSRDTDLTCFWMKVSQCPLTE